MGGGPGAVTGIPALRPGANHAYILDTGLVRAVAAQVAEAQDLQAQRRSVREVCDAACVRAWVSTNLAVGLALFTARKALVALRNGCLVLRINPCPTVFTRPFHHFSNCRNTLCQ
jgi:hypothetical protein